ncbi:MAG: CbiX/SirB N-terminal domain-containing protein [Verrucomicrobia bacterium]|nr:CbiX/SirB N-terminal domain-containing protein [Verrucomicrobiota bacterium]
MKKTCLVLIAHGSKNPRWTAPFQKLAEDLGREVGQDKVFLCFMELAQPSLQEVAARIVQGGTSHFRLLPLFLASGNHLDHDLPAQVEDVKRQLPGLEIEMLPPIGQHPMFATLMRQLARECVG